jgi:hypothetical protein
LKHGKEANSGEICAYYDSQWMTLSPALHVETFEIYLEEAWLLLMRDLKRKLLYENPTISESFVGELVRIGMSFVISLSLSLSLSLSICSI